MLLAKCGMVIAVEHARQWIGDAPAGGIARTIEAGLAPACGADA
jgi:hypothetical protein